MDNNINNRNNMNKKKKNKDEKNNKQNIQQFPIKQYPKNSIRKEFKLKHISVLFKLIKRDYLMLFLYQTIAYNIIYIRKMNSQGLCRPLFLFVKLNVSSFLILVIGILAIMGKNQYEQKCTDMQEFTKKIQSGPNDYQSQIGFDQFLKVLSQSKFSGTWISSIKESNLLSQQNGTIQLKSFNKSRNIEEKQYKIQIKIYDGEYQDNGYYQIQLESNSVKTQQQFIKNHLIYETTSPVIGLYKNKKVFLTQKQKPIFINKLKFRLIYEETLQIQLLFAAEYEINIITQGLEQSWIIFQQLVFCFVIVLQALIQSYGGFQLYQQVSQQEMIANSISPTFLKLGTCFDIVEALLLLYIAIQGKLKFLPIGIFFLYFFIVIIEAQILYQINYVIDRARYLRIRQFQRTHPNIQQNQISFQNLQQSGRQLDNSSIKSLVSLVQRNQDYLMYICAFFIFYMNNMQTYIYIIFFLIILLPQITRNLRNGNKINYSVQSVFIFSFPRLLPILYYRLLGKNSMFFFQPELISCFFCVLLCLATSCVLFIQKKHGARSILPKFLIPKGMKAKFKFFMIQDESLICRICRSELSQLPVQLQKQSKLKEQIIYNRVVLTPCVHKFHASCLDKWMESRIQCPSCYSTLPPLEIQ